MDGISDFDTLHSGKHDEEVQLCAFDILVEGSDDLRKLPLHLRETSLERPLARRPECIFVNPFERGEIGPDLYRAACRMGLEGGVERSHAEVLVTGNAFARKSPPHPILAQCRLAASKNLRSEAGTSSYSMKRRRTSSAMSTVASRDQPLAVLKATMRTGSSYCPASKSRTSVSRSVSASSASRHALPR